MAPEGATIRNQYPEEVKSTTVVVKWSDSVEVPRFKLDGPLCEELYKEDDGYIVTWSVTDPVSKMN